MDTQLYRAMSSELLKLAKAPKRPKKAPSPALSPLAMSLMKELGDTRLRQAPEEAALYGGGAFDFKKNEIIMDGHDPSTLAHEIGHAHFQKELLGKLTQNVPSRLAQALSPAAGYPAGALLAGRSKSMGALALAAPVLAAAPTLISEGVASYKGHELLSRAGASKDELASYRKKMLHGFGTYSVAPAVGTLLAGAGLLTG